MPQSYCRLLYHIVFSTKNRRPDIQGELTARLHAYLGGAIRDMGGTAIIVNGTEDHIHVLASLRQDKTIADTIRTVKANSSGWIHRTFPERADFAWQAGYGAFTVSESQSDIVKRYIERQEEHHHKMTFKEEFTALLDAHGIAYQEAHLWT